MPEIVRKVIAEREQERLDEELQEFFDDKSIWLHQWELRPIRYPITAISQEAQNRILDAKNETDIKEAFKDFVNESMYHLYPSREIKAVIQFDEIREEVLAAAQLLVDHTHWVTSFLLYKGFPVAQTKFEIVDEMPSATPNIKKSDTPLLSESPVLSRPPLRIPVNKINKKLEFDVMSDASEDEDKPSTPFPSFNLSSIKPTTTSVSTTLSTTMEYILQGVAEGRVPVDDVARLLNSLSMSDGRNSTFHQENVAPSKSANQVVAVMKREPGQFHGDFDAPEKAKRWLRELKEVGEFQGWTSNQYRLMFKQKLTGHAINWYKQLDSNIRKDWSRLQAAFKEKYCAGSESKRQKYYRMTQGQSSALNYLYALNTAARKADIDYNGNKSDREEHFKQYCDTLNDKTLSDSLRLKEYSTIQQLESAVERWERGQKKPKSILDKKSRTPGPPPRVQFLDVEEEEKVSESQSIQSIHSIVQTILNQLPAGKIASTQSDQRSQSAPSGSNKLPTKSGKDSQRPSCTHCKKSGHTVERCFRLQTCSFCGEKGHNDNYCLQKAQKVITMHERAAKNPKVLAAMPDDMIQELKD